MSSLRSLSWLSVIGLLVLCLTSQAGAQPIAWTGAAGDNVWTNPGNWTPTVVPGANNDVTIAVGSGPITIPPSSTARARSIVTSRTLVVGSSASLSLAAGLTFNPDGGLTVNSGAFVDFIASQSVSGNATITLNNGSLYASNQSQITLGSGITVVCGSTFGTLWYNTGQGSTFVNFGVIRATAGRSIRFENGVSLDNRGLVESTGALSSVVLGSGSGAMNSGSIRAGEAGRVELASVVNTGTVTSTGLGSLVRIDNFSAAGAGAFLAQATGTLRLGGTYTTAALASVNRNGGGLVELTGIINGAGGPPLRLVTDPVETQLQASSQGVQLNSVTLGAPLVLSGGTTRVTGGLALNGRQVQMGGSATMDFLGTQSVTGPGEIRGVSGSNNLYASSNGQITLGADVTTRAVTGSLTFWWNSAPPTSFVNLGAIRADGSATLNSFSGTTLINRGTLTVGASPGNQFVAIQNEGLITVSGASTQVSMPATANVGSGTTAISNNARVLIGGEYAPSALTGFTTSTGGVLQLGGTINGGVLPIVGLATVLQSPHLAGVTINQDLTIPSGASVTRGLTVRNCTATVQSLLSTSGGLVLDGGAVALTNATLDFRGTQSISGSGEILASGNSNLYSSGVNAVVTIGPGVTVRTVSVGGLTLWWNGSPPTAFRNRGVIRAQVGPIQVLDRTALINEGVLESLSAAAPFSFENLSTLGNYDPATRTLAGTPGAPASTWVARNGGGFNFPISPGNPPNPANQAYVERIGPGARVILDGPLSRFNAIDPSTAATPPGPSPSRLNSLQGLLMLDGGRVLNVQPLGGILTSAGEIRLGPGARLNVAGAYTQAATGRLAVEASAAAASGRGLLTASTTSAFSGAAEFIARDGFSAACGDTFELLTAPVVSGLIGEQTALLPGQLPATFSLEPTALRMSITTPGLLPGTLNDAPFSACGSTITLVARPTNPLVALRWLKDGIPMSDGPTGVGAVVSGATTSTLTLAGLGNADAGSYRLQATSACGQAVSDSADVTLLGTCNCPTDFNGDGATDPDDLSDYITCYFSIPPCVGADFNDDGNTDPDDLSDYITAFFSGC